MKQTKQTISGYLYLVLTILIWSATPAVAKLALRELSNYQLLFYTSIIGSVSLFAINFFQRKLPLFRQYRAKDYCVMFGMGAVGIFLYYAFLYKAFALAPAGQVNVVNYLWPVFIIIFSLPILHEKLHGKTILAVLISFAGAMISFTQGNLAVFSGDHGRGYLLAALGAICYGLFSVVGKKLAYEKFSSMLVYYLAATILIIPTSLAISGFALPKSLTTISAILFLGGNSVAFVFWFKALQAGNTHTTANLIYTVPFLAMIWTYFLNGENFSGASIVGLALIIAGIFLQLTNGILSPHRVQSRSC